MGLITITDAEDGDAVNAALINDRIRPLVNLLNGNLDNQNISASAAISPDKLAGGSATMLSAWESFTPTIAGTGGGTAAAVGSGTLVGYKKQIGKTLKFIIEFTLGSGSALGSASTQFGLGSNTIEITHFDARMPCGQLEYYDASVPAAYAGFVAVKTNNLLDLYMYNAAGTYASPFGISQSVPVSPASGDIIRVRGEVEVT